MVGEPLERMTIDITEPFHESRTGNQFVAVIINYFTKWVEFIAMPDHTAETRSKVDGSSGLHKSRSTKIPTLQPGNQFPEPTICGNLPVIQYQVDQNHSVASAK